MDYIKIQQEILKNNTKKNEKWKHGISKKGDVVVLNPQGSLLVIIPQEVFYLDATKIFNQPISNVDNLINYGDAPVMTLSNVSEELDKKLKARLFLSENDDEVFVDEKYLKYFNNCDEFRGKGARSCVFCFENDECVGLVLPVNKMKH